MIGTHFQWDISLMISGSFLRQKILAVLNCLLGEAVPASINQLQHLSKTNKLHLVHNCQLPSLCQYIHTSCIAYRSCIMCHMQYHVQLLQLSMHLVVQPCTSNYMYYICYEGKLEMKKCVIISFHIMLPCFK